RSEMEAVIEKVREKMRKRQFGIEEQLKTLGDLMEGVRGGKGGSAIVFGQRESGRTAVVEEALEKHAKGVSVNRLWLSRLGTDSNALQTLVESESSSSPLIVVVDSADDLVCKSKQALLYRLLDRTKTQPWLVLLIITRQDMTSSLEKRVRSRLSNARVLMGEAMEEEKWERVVHMMLDPREGEEKENAPVAVVAKGGKKGKNKKETAVEKGNERTEEEKKWSEFVSLFLADPEVTRLKKALYEHSGNISTAKSAINLWCVIMEAEDVETAMNGESTEEVRRDAFNRLVDNWRQSIEAVVPIRDTVADAIHNIPRRTFCVLVAVARRLRCNPTGVFSYSKIAVDFMHQCNHVDKRMMVTMTGEEEEGGKRMMSGSELSTFKELDRLCEMGLLAAVGGAASQSHSFRQVSLNCSLQSLLSNVRAGCQNSALKDWFESQPVN
ncbi:hypothetical protein PFISCL1PPCAC_12427, partial [Pristionchus fissidentatus]